MSARIRSPYRRASFLEGFSRVFDLSGSRRLTRGVRFSKRSDADALRSDWEAIGADFRRAVAVEKAKHPELR